jgi:Holliday junction resolvase RusA-like endonuclease
MGYDDRKRIDFSVIGHEPVPWSAPHVSRYGGSTPNKRLVAWKTLIAAIAHQEFGPYAPWEGPIGFSATFLLKRGMPKHASGLYACPSVTFNETYSTNKLKHKGSDLTNLIKAAEDALQGIVFVNDAQVCEHPGCKSLWNSVPGVQITISRLDK